ncbi:MAG: TIGR03767 family metallophosphoesterase [Nitriliruptorales bacterium]|nr:TIGR03767 family metallophosphoesterase [Nitriliruptorales bacterium]
MTSPRWRPRRRLTRREFVQRMAALSAAGWATPMLSGSALRNAWAQTADSVMFPSRTTLERTIVTAGEGPYFSLTYGPGWPITVREELASAKAGRVDKRVALAAFLHVTDFQLVDAQSPARVEFFDRTSDEPSQQIPVNAAFRPQEALVSHAVDALNRRARTLLRSPVTGRFVDFCICTGDNIDNKQANELRWFITLMDGGNFAANSGAADTFEGVQTFDAPEYYDDHYYHPNPVDDPRAPDDYKLLYGFPDYPGLLAAAIQQFTAVGVGLPWYSAYGNHDGLVQGNVQANPTFEAVATGDLKVLAPPPGITPNDFYQAGQSGNPEAVFTGSVAAARPVTADAERTFITAAEYIQAHLNSPTSPNGHGFTEDNLDPVTLYYTFDVAESILGITLDTTSPASSEGSIGQTQLDWLEQRLLEVQSHYYDADGNEQTTGNDDRLVIVYSHHRPASMVPIQGVDEQGNLEQRYGGDTVIELLQRFPNVILWVNGHSHYNRIVVHGHADPVRGFWDLTTSAQVDPPQQARILEVVDNRDGTLSIFTTVIDHAAEPGTSAEDYSVLGLAAIGRELAYNDYQSTPASAIGQPEDTNTELLVVAPFDLSGTGGDGAPADDGSEGGGRAMPATGGGMGVAAAAALLGGALALRNRRSDRPD